MAHLIETEHLEMLIDLPDEHYNFSRFDWTGKISAVKFKKMLFTTYEQIDGKNEHQIGKGFYNEFGIDRPLGFDETPVGGWFHKIGVGLLKKEDDHYLFSQNYKIKPANFNYGIDSNSVLIRCNSENYDGYSYILKKEIRANESSFTINYNLENTGNKAIITDEYAHNFISFNKEPIGRDCVLKFPFQLKPHEFGETVNPESKVKIERNEIKFNSSPEKEFFFSKLNGDQLVAANWELTHLTYGIRITETGSFQSKKINLWGCKHVICPELFFDIHLQPGQSVGWNRVYDFYNF
ncbi:MAG: hypothetical protein KJN76_05585 [Eudoraea sp.]|nr:hypothetical protein [Eudoraea sp.]